jgi:pilus assembly protein CpaE
VLLASMDVASVRNLGKEVDALDRLGFTGGPPALRPEPGRRPRRARVADVETAVGLKVEAALPSSRLVPLSMNQGRILVLDEPDAPVAQELLAFANRFLDAEATPIAGRRPTRFSLRRR